MAYCPYYALYRTSSPSFEPVALAEAKLYLRVDHSDDDVLISEMIVAARMAAEHYLSRSLVGQGWHVEYRLPEATTVTLPMRPVSSVAQVSVEYSAGDAPVVLTAQEYALRGNELYVAGMAGWYHVHVDYRAGHEALTHIAADIRQGVLEHINLWYDLRGMDAPMPAASMQHYARHKEVRI